MRTRLKLAGLLLLSPAFARAEMALEKVQWQLVKRERPTGALKSEDIGALKLAGPKLSGKLRAKVSLANGEAKAVEGILLRYSLCARLAPEDGKGAGVWAVPFLIEERRVPKVGAKETLEVPLDTSPMFELYLKRVAREGFAPDQLKLQVMVEPRRGEIRTIALLESALPVGR